jgi:acyl carrier protein
MSCTTRGAHPMTRDDIVTKLNSVFRSVFLDDEILVSDAMTASDVEAWDSLNNVRMLVAVEQSFGVKFGTLEIEDLKNVGELISLIAKKKSA